MVTFEQNRKGVILGIYCTKNKELKLKNNTPTQDSFSINIKRANINVKINISSNIYGYDKLTGLE